jgi:hypothetical protein
MSRKYVVLSALVVMVAGCGSARMGKIEEFPSPEVDASTFKRITVIADGARRSDMQVTARARERLTNAGVELVKRAGTWETDTQAVREICVQNPTATDNVDGVLLVGWNRVTLHDCASGKIATNITGNYAGVDALVDRLLRYMGRTPPEK